MPRQTKAVASVAMIEGMPIRATSRPLMKPTKRADAERGDDAEPAELRLQRLDLLGRAPFRQPVQPEHVVEAVEGREDHARERDHRGKGEIDLARRDHQREAERADDLRLVVDHDRDVGAPAEEGVGRQRHQRDQHDDQNQQDRHALGRRAARAISGRARRRRPPGRAAGDSRHATASFLACSASRWSVSWCRLISPRLMSLTISPRSITTRRSASSCTCARLCSI